MAYKFQLALNPLLEHKNSVLKQTIKTFFAEDANRFDKLSIKFEDILFDYSKHQVSDETLKLLEQLAIECDFEAKRDAFFKGDKINFTEKRSVMHWALRQPNWALRQPNWALRQPELALRQAELINSASHNGPIAPPIIDGQNINGDVHRVLDAMADFAQSIRNSKIRDVVNIGIGGSDLGPAMVTGALDPYCDGPKCHYVSNVDGADLATVLKPLNAETTLFIVASKTFTTQETMTNANTARQWLVAALGDEAVKDHFAALSTNLEQVAAFGIEPSRAFGFWDWVGGRYSLWSAIGLSTMIAIGVDNFKALLAGAYSVDEHFKSAPILQNIPAIMGLLGIWYRNVLDYESVGVMPYDNRLARLPAFLQQLDMESNGKAIMRNGDYAPYKTGPIVWGEPGTNGQHAFYQLIHQGTSIVPIDFLVAAQHFDKIGDGSNMEDHHQKLLANCFAQSEALMLGKTLSEAKAELKAAKLSENDINALASHKVFLGNRPSSTFLYQKLTPRTLGQLIAFYEHKVFVQGAIWDINSFDQWGVELGKQLANRLLPMVKGEQAVENKDSSTKGLLAHYKALKGQPL